MCRCDGYFNTTTHVGITQTAVALLPHSMQNSIVHMGLRAVFSDWLHPIITTNQITVYLKHVGLFYFSTSSYIARSERHCVSVQLELGVACIAVVPVYSEDWQRNGGMRGFE